MELTLSSKIDYIANLKFHHITLTEETLQKFWTDNDNGSLYNQRFAITLENGITWKCGSMVLGNSQAYITISKVRMKGIKAERGDKIEFTLIREFSKYGFEVPVEFEEVLNQDEHARNRFEALTMGTQRATIYLVLQLKSSQKRIDKSLLLMNNIKRAPEKITMRHILGKDLD